MKSILKSLGLAVLTLGLATGIAIAGSLSVSVDKVDFGNMKEGLVAKKKVVLTNTGQSPLTIANVTTN